MNEIRQSSRPNPVAFLDELTPVDASSVGEKAVALGILGRSGFAVPDGFVVRADVPAAVAAAYHELERRTGRPAIPVAVRASSTADERTAGPPAAAETNVSGTADVIDAVRRRLAGDAEPVAVVVQAMAAGGRAGIAYTVDPVRRDDGIVRVTAGFGGDTTWSAPHEVDTYLVSRRTGEVVQAVVVAKGGRLGQYRRVLTDDEARRVAATALDVEHCLGRPLAVDYLFASSGRIVVLKTSPLERNRAAAVA